MTDNARSPATGALVIFGLLLALPVIYALSVGPAIALVDRTGMGHELLPTIYGPLDWTEGTFLETPLHRYVEFWRGQPW